MMIMKKLAHTATADPLFGGSAISDRILLAAVAAWCTAMIAAPLFDSGVIYGFFSSICHQYPERSWFLFGRPLAVCIRCAAIYGGFLIALLLEMPAKTGLLRWAVALTAVEFVVAHLIIDMEVVRAFSGLLLGLAAAGFVAQGFRELTGPLARTSRRDSFENV
jgi:uncharacterized membrane protein